MWTNRDDIPHTIASKDKLFKSKVMDSGESYSFTFTTPSEYSYFCSLHPHMTGTIVVEAATGSAASRGATPVSPGAGCAYDEG
jgi:plastocyanin